MPMSARVLLFWLLAAAASVSAGCSDASEPARDHNLERRLRRAEAENERLGSELEAVRTELGALRERLDLLDGSALISAWHEHVVMTIDERLYLSHGLQPFDNFGFTPGTRSPRTDRTLLLRRSGSMCSVLLRLRSRSSCPASVDVGALGGPVVRSRVSQNERGVCLVDARFPCEPEEMIMVAVFP